MKPSEAPKERPPEETICPVCKNARTQSLADYNRLPMRRCPACSLVFCSQRQFSTDEYNKIYDKLPGYKWLKNIAEQTAKGEKGFADLWRYKRIALQWLESGGVQKHVLDIGCGPGHFLLVARQRGWKVAGVEVAQQAAEQARSYGLDIHHGIVEVDTRWKDQKPGAITAFEVLEHVTDPVSMLKTIADLMQPDGLLVMSVPNVDDPYCLVQQDPASMPPVHLNFFNRRSLRRAMELAGLKPVRFYSFPIPTNSARRCLGKWKYLLSIPLLLAMRVIGKSDGTSLLALARKA